MIQPDDMIKVLMNVQGFWLLESLNYTRDLFVFLFYCKLGKVVLWRVDGINAWPSVRDFHLPKL